MIEAEIERYLDDTSRIEGWFFPIDASLFGAIDEIQQHERIAGNLFEIGVHHGKSAVLLAKMLKEGEVLGVCDVFEQQNLNVDRSGEGSRELFQRNMAEFSPAAMNRIRIFAKRSDQLTIEDTTHTCRFVHIDGGHRPLDVVNDLRVAERALLNDGIVAVDDVFNPSWPGVGEGMYAYYMQRPNVFAPTIIGGNKVFFARPEASNRYESWFGRIAAGVLFRSAAFRFEYKEWLGHQVLTASRLEWVDLRPMEAARLHRRP